MDTSLQTAIVAASSAVFGAIAGQIGQVLLSVYKRRQESSVALQLKYEELADRLNDALEWANLLLASLEKDEKPSIHTAAPFSARKIYSLCLIYFPNLKPHATEFLLACVEYGELYHQMSSGLASVDMREVHRINKKFQDSRKSLDSAIENYSKMYVRT